MFKKIFVVVLLLGFAWGYYPTRVRMMHALQPLLVKLGPAGYAIVLPTQRYSARQEVAFIVEQLQMHKTEGRELPDERTFQKWIGRRLATKNKGNDPWNFPYYMLKTSGRVTIGSVGPDGRRGTDDDINKTVPF